MGSGPSEGAAAVRARRLRALRRLDPRRSGAEAAGAPAAVPQGSGAGGPRAPAARLLVRVPGDAVDVGRDVLRVLAVDDAGRHLALAAGAAVLDRVEDQALRHVAAVQLVQVRADLAD